LPPPSLLKADDARGGAAKAEAAGGAADDQGSGSNESGFQVLARFGEVCPPLPPPPKAPEDEVVGWKREEEPLLTRGALNLRRWKGGQLERAREGKPFAISSCPGRRGFNDEDAAHGDVDRGDAASGREA
jgi:hypothetical protein